MIRPGKEVNMAAIFFYSHKKNMKQLSINTFFLRVTTIIRTFEQDHLKRLL